MKPITKRKVDFTKREVEILKLLDDGLPVKLIADKLGMSIPTVNSHCRTMRTKTGAHSQRELLKCARQEGYLE